MANASITWRGKEQVKANMAEYGRRVIIAVKAVLEYIGPVIVTEIQRQGRWVDRTANMRQSVHYIIRDISEQIVSLYISYGVYYAVFVETGFQGRYSTLWPVLTQHFPIIMDMLNGIFR